ncbi:hypothetical protein ACFQU2_24655 [Siccirubricoccus deserti]
MRSTYAVAAPVGGVPETAAPALPLGQALLWAFLGGLLLNLMPCVFPVLAMKAMALARLSGAARVEVRAHAASYTLGVLATFLALAGLLIGLRAGGVAAGWGFQFTAPAFVAALAWLMLAVGLNLSGVYDLGRTVGAGGALAARGGHAGSFATGALAVLVATPCTAPSWRQRSAPPSPCRRRRHWRSSPPSASGLRHPMRYSASSLALPASCRGRAAGWNGCARASPSRCMAPRPGSPGFWRSRRGRRDWPSCSLARC